jgi:tetratricopeptide (TPR) repeat protein
VPRSRTRAAAGLACAALLAADAASTADSYLDVVRRYAAGERAAAVAALDAWKPGELARELAELREAALIAAQRGTQLPANAMPPLRAVMLLHTDREALERTPAPGAEHAPACREQVHTALAERIAGLLFADPEGREFARRWYLAVALRDLGYTCFDDAEHWLEAGLRWFPKDAELLLALGTIDEATTALASRDPAIGPLRGSQRAQVLESLHEKRFRLERAARRFEQALASDPRLAEARLRLGRVRYRQGRRPEARELLRAVAEESGMPALTYLARLFLGRVHEADGEPAEAAAEYEKALALEPQSQAAAVALSYVREQLGEPRAREPLLASLAHAGRRAAFDPYWEYPIAHAVPRSESLLDALREEASR